MFTACFRQARICNRLNGGSGGMVEEPDVETVRQLAEKRVAESTRVQVAQDMGLPETNLRCFLAGSQPRPEAWMILREWYLEYRPAPDVVASADFERLVDALLADLVGPARHEARLRIASALAQGHRRMGREEPVWLRGRR
jgi:hypothetical protein